MMKLLCLTILLAAVLFVHGQGMGGRGMGGHGMGGHGMGGPGMRGHGMGGPGMRGHHYRHHGRGGYMDPGIVRCRATCWDENSPEECMNLLGFARICAGRMRENRMECMSKCPEYDRELMARFDGPAQ